MSLEIKSRTVKSFAVLLFTFTIISLTLFTARVRAERYHNPAPAVALNQDGLQPMLPGTIFTVTKVADTNDGFCNADCSLREAIVAANAHPGTDSIAFNIGTGIKTLFPTSQLPSISDPVVVDGTTQPGFSGTPLIEIDGTNAGAVPGLIITGGNSTVRGLVINGFRSTALQLLNNGNNVVAGNYFGTNAAGTATHGGTQNNGIGILASTPNNIIGGTTAADRNIISGNKNVNVSSGIWLQGATATGNKVIGNYIGTDVTGEIPIPHNNAGVSVFSGASGNFIGGSTLERNIICAGGNVGISLNDAVSNTVRRNSIGVSPTGKELGSGFGVDITGASHDNVIGGSNAGEGNVIAYSNQKAVWTHSFTVANKNAILGNSIFDNNFGIDLGANGVTSNDPNDVDTGDNNLQNFPLIASAAPNGNSITINGTLNSVANTQYRIELFSSPTCNPSGNGEGKNFLGATTASLAGNDGTFNATFPVNVVNTYITATATDPNGNTSEFSPCALAGNANVGTLRFNTSTSFIEEGQAQTITVNRDGGSVGAVSVQYSLVPQTATPGVDYEAASGTLNWADGDSAPKTFQVVTKPDFLSESSETLKVVLNNAAGSPLGNPSVQVLTIIDDIPVVSITDVTKPEGNSGTTDYVFGVTLSHQTDQNVSFKFSAADATAMLGSDFQPSSGTVTFTPGQVSQQIIVQVNGDTDPEPNETFFLQLTNAVGLSLAQATPQGTILNDDGALQPAIGFLQSTFNAQEGFGSVILNVSRSGDSSVTSSIHYITGNVTASQKSDFEISAGRLIFGPGETTKTIIVLINDDMYVEGTESFQVILDAPTNCTIGPNSTATVNINENSSESPTNPIDDTDNFVRMQYHDFLNRDPDSAGLSFWVGQIMACGSNQQCVSVQRNNVSAAFFLSIEFQRTGYLVYRTHKAAFGAVNGGPTPLIYDTFMADTQRIGRGVVVNAPGWEQLLENNTQAYMLNFVEAQAFANKYPTSMQAVAFVDALFATAGVVPSAIERSDAIAQFSNPGDTSNLQERAKALRLIAENKSLAQQEFNKAFVLMQYYGYLRRNPNDSPEPGQNFDGYNFWLNKLNAFNGNYISAELVKAFIESSEYRQRFGN